MSDKIDIGAKSIFRVFLLTSAAIYAELFILPYIFPWVYNTIPKEAFDEYIRPVTDMVFFIFILGSLLIRSKGLGLKKSLDVKYLVLHMVLVGAFVIFLMRVMAAYPFQALGPDHWIIRITQVFNKTITYFRVRFRIAYMLLAVGAHYALLKTFVQDKKAWIKYVVATPLAFFFAELADMFVFLKDILITSIVRVEEVLLNVSGLGAYCLYFPERDPIIGTSSYQVAIAYGCSGMNGLALFGILFTGLLVLEWDKLNKIRALAVGICGIGFMYVTNIVRIYVIILIGHFTSNEYVVEVFHNYGSMVLYVIATLFIIGSTHKWMIKSEKKGETDAEEV